MALNTAYLITTKNLEPFFNSLITAKAPDIFTQKVLESLEFKSTNDRLYIALLKGLGFLDTTGAPTSRYYDFLDQSQSKKVLADAIKESYSDLFAVNINANELTVDEAKNKFRTLTQGRNSEKVVALMANTFVALVKYADWAISPTKVAPPLAAATDSKKPSSVQSTVGEEPEDDVPSVHSQKTQLHYNIQIHLPDSRDPAVYDALFKSLKKHLF